MHAHEREPQHEHDESPRQRHAPGALDTPAELPHLLRAAVTGRPEVVGRHGMSALQRTVGNGAVGSVFQRERDDEAEGSGRSSVHDVLASGGEPLDTDARGEMEARLGADFSDVRVHTGPAAHESAREVGARAYTVGNDVVFQRDAYDPGSHQGRTTLAHELTHVIQQRNGPVDGTEAPGGIRVSDPSDRFEQEAAANAERAMSEPLPAAPTAEAVAPAGATAAVQRQSENEGEDEEPADVQGDFVQRAAADESAEEEETEPSS
ncbi:eCIS core domain-containing protein [Streptomyces millisiae]|uniref:DUF4157 domain-containing protein n=1 Tax=Streptomyces millisiae TaxID=3075542 RepID=A0ABU2LP41_9ACTN|nr:DUF4157 domain-containing protein [Streptomyces sp. DSM 44918]MDT0319351.1 DUF4157 domain-containing protein [Streptomyces sp. DSM 44918]